VGQHQERRIVLRGQVGLLEATMEQLAMVERLVELVNLLLEECPRTSTREPLRLPVVLLLRG
jgi:hypothetical protein